MVKSPLALCFFEDHKDSSEEASSYGDLKKMQEHDIFYHLKNSPFNYDIAKHILEVSVTRGENGNVVGSIAIDNEASMYTSRLFSRLFANYQEKSPDKDKADFIAEGVGVVIYMGYYTGEGKWDYITKKLDGVIESVAFSFQQNGTPQFVLSVTDSYTFMGNSKMKNTEATLQEPGSKGVPMRSSFPYISRANATEVGLLTGKLFYTGSAGEAKAQSATGVQAKDVTAGKTKASAEAGAKKAAQKLRAATALRQFNIFSQNPGIRDSQAVLQIIKRYNDKIEAIYPTVRNMFFVEAKKNFPDISDEDFLKRNQRMADKLLIKKCFVCMTGEGGVRYDTLSVFNPRVRDNKVAQPVQMGFSDLLLSLASKHHFEVFVKDGCLFFMPPILKKTPDLIYYYGNSEKELPYRLLSFEPQLSSVSLGTDYHAFEFNPDNGMVDFIRSQFGDGLDEAVVYTLRVLTEDGVEVAEHNIRGNTTAVQAQKDAQEKLSNLTGSDYVVLTHFSSGTEEVIKAITETEADAISASLSMEGNPHLELGMTIGVAGIDSKGTKPEHKRFDGVYRLTEITDTYRGTYITSVKAMTRALQGVSAISNWDDNVLPYKGMWSTALRMEPSHIWAMSDEKRQTEIYNSIENYFGLLKKANDKFNTAEQEIKSLKNNENQKYKDGITGVHTIALQTDVLTIGDEGMYASIAQAIPPITYEEAFEILGYGRLDKVRDDSVRLLPEGEAYA